MIASLCNLAALYANRAGRDTILRRDFLDALAQEETGALADTHSDFVTERVALVEAATALVATLLPVIEEVEAVTIAPTERRRLGQTMLKQHEPRVLTRLYTRRYLEARRRPARLHPLPPPLWRRTRAAPALQSGCGTARPVALKGLIVL